MEVGRLRAPRGEAQYARRWRSWASVSSPQPALKLERTRPARAAMQGVELVSCGSTGCRDHVAHGVQSRDGVRGTGWSLVQEKPHHTAISWTQVCCRLWTP